MLISSNISREIQLKNPQAVLDVLNYYETSAKLPPQDKFMTSQYIYYISFKNRISREPRVGNIVRSYKKKSFSYYDFTNSSTKFTFQYSGWVKSLGTLPITIRKQLSKFFYNGLRILMKYLSKTVTGWFRLLYSRKRYKLRV